jgi:hypothetical protein
MGGPLSWGVGEVLCAVEPQRKEGGGICPGSRLLESWVHGEGLMHPVETQIRISTCSSTPEEWIWVLFVCLF